MRRLWTSVVAFSVGVSVTLWLYGSQVQRAQEVCAEKLWNLRSESTSIARDRMTILAAFRDDESDSAEATVLRLREDLESQVNALEEMLTNYEIGVEHGSEYLVSPLGKKILKAEVESLHHLAKDELQQW